MSTQPTTFPEPSADHSPNKFGTVPATDPALYSAGPEAVEQSLSASNPPRFGLVKTRRDEMDNETQALMRRYIARAAIQLLSQQGTEENATVREAQFCHILMAAFVQRFQGSTRLDHILRSINTEGAQHPALLKLAREMDTVFTDLRDDLILQLAGQVKNPEAPGLNIPISPELQQKIQARLKAKAKSSPHH